MMMTRSTKADDIRMQRMDRVENGQNGHSNGGTNGHAYNNSAYNP